MAGNGLVYQAPTPVPGTRKRPAPRKPRIGKHEKPLAKVIGLKIKVPLLGKRRARYANLDNAASTPPLEVVYRAVNEFMPWYSSVHRGDGFKSRLSTEIYEEGREWVKKFVGAEKGDRTVIFVKNTTEAINKLIYRLELKASDVVITTALEHHSNMLGWRRCRLIYGKLLSDGRLDLEDLRKQIKKHAGKLRLVAVSGASNVTGYMPPIGKVARWVHEAGAEILVDGAQLVPHRKVDMGDPEGDGSIDYLAFSAHKMYAPYGTGVLIGPKKTFERGAPDYRGGGTVDIVTLDSVVWTAPPDRDEAGSPNTVGVVALSAAIKELLRIGMAGVEKHEKYLAEKMVSGLRKIPNFILLGHPEGHDDEHLGVFSFNIEGLDHGLVSAVLSWEYGIATRHGCFCAHPYALELLRVPEPEVKKVRKRIMDGNKAYVPGAARASLGLYNTTQDVDIFLRALKNISSGKIKGEYKLDKKTGNWDPVDAPSDYRKYFHI